MYACLAILQAVFMLLLYVAQTFAVVQTSHSVIQGYRNGLHVMFCFPDSSSRLCKEYSVFSYVILRKSYNSLLLA